MGKRFPVGTRVGDCGAKEMPMFTHVSMQIINLEQTVDSDKKAILMVMENRLIVCLHFTWENVLIQLGQTFDRPILDGRREHLASLANMAPTLKKTAGERKKQQNKYRLDDYYTAMTLSESSIWI